MPPGMIMTTSLPSDDSPPPSLPPPHPRSLSVSMDVASVAGKKHPSTPPPPPIPPRSSRRPTAASASASSAASRAMSQGLKFLRGASELRESKQLKEEGAAKTTATTAAAVTLGQQSEQHQEQPFQQKQEQPQPQQQQQQEVATVRQSSPNKQPPDDIDREASNVCEFIEDRLYFMWTATNPISTRRTTYLTIDNYLQYMAFFSDFGPFDIADVFRFCCLMKERLELARTQGKVLCLHTKPEDQKRANAGFALCCYMMLLQNKTPEEAYAPIEYVHPPFMPYRDAGCGPVTYTLTILDCLRGLRKGLDLGLLRLDRFDVKEYEHYERVSSGDFNWVTPFFIAFAGPKDKMTHEELLQYRATRAVRASGSGSRSGSARSESEISSSSSTESSSSGSSSSAPTTASPRATTPGLSTIPSSSPADLSLGREYNNIHPSSSSSMDSEEQDANSDTSISTSTSIRSVTTRKKKNKRRTRLTKRFQSVLDYFVSHSVKCVIRLNDPTYDEAHFQTLGMDHVDLIYPDGTCPPWSIVERFLKICDDVILGHREEDTGVAVEGQGPGFGSEGGGGGGRGVVAVHCMAGLGRTGTLIGVFLMRHFDMTARETIAFLRLMRPGSVVGPQQNWLAQNENRIRMKTRGWEYVQAQRYNQQQQQQQQQGLAALKEGQGKVSRSRCMTPNARSRTYDSTKKSSPASWTATAPWLIPKSQLLASLVPTPKTDYEQVFSRANSEGLESTWSEIEELDSESEVEGDALSATSFSRISDSSGAPKGHEDESDDVNGTTTEEESIGLDADTTDDDNGDENEQQQQKQQQNSDIFSCPPVEAGAAVNVPRGEQNSHAQARARTGAYGFCIAGDKSRSTYAPSPLRASHNHVRLASISYLENISAQLDMNPVENEKEEEEEEEEEAIEGEMGRDARKDKRQTHTYKQTQTQTQSVDRSLGKEHIGNREYVIPAQPRKQEQNPRQEDIISTKASLPLLTSADAQAYRARPFCSQQSRKSDRHNIHRATVAAAVATGSDSIDKHKINNNSNNNSNSGRSGMKNTKTKKRALASMPDKAPFLQSESVIDPASPPSLNNEDDSTTTTSSTNGEDHVMGNTGGSLLPLQSQGTVSLLDVDLGLDMVRRRGSRAAGGLEMGR